MSKCAVPTNYFGAFDREKEVLKGANKMNVFRKENRRRILFTLTLTLLAAVLSFGFISRAVEYLSIKQELDRLSDNYRTIGWLSSADGHVAEGIELIKESPYVETADERGFLWGTLTDLYNADLQGKWEGYWTDIYGVNNAEVFFWGTLKYVDEDWYERDRTDGGQMAATRFVFTVSERISGYPDYVPEGGDVAIVITDEMLKSGGCGLPELTVGESYLVRAYYDTGRNGFWPGYELWASAAGGHALTVLPVQESALFLTKEEGEAALSALVSDERMQFDELNRHSMSVIATRDMSAMPAAQDVQKRMFLTEGRWLDEIDSNTGAAVCAVHRDFAEARGLHVGDTIELTFRCAQLELGYALGEQDVSDWQTYESETRQYTIAGIFDYMPLNEGVHNASEENMELYIPYGSAPKAYIGSRGSWSQNFSFVLEHPQDTDAFLREVQEPLAAMGIKVQLIENNWEAFAVSANAMERSACLGVFVFLGVLCLGFVLIAYLYGRQNRKSFGIARALGMPKGKCIRMCLVPMVCMSVIGNGAGALLSWHYALGEAEHMLTGMQEHAEMRLSVWWLAGLIFVSAFLMTAAAAIVVFAMARRPVTELLRDASGSRKTVEGVKAESEKGLAKHAGENAVRGGERYAAENGAGAGDGSPVWQISLPTEAGRGKGTVCACRFVWRHIRRRPVHTTLVVAVALAFLAAIAWMQMSIVKDTNEVDRLYANTEIEGELVKQDLSVTNGQSGAFVTQGMIEWLKESGYVQDLYTEAAGEISLDHRTGYDTATMAWIEEAVGTDVPVRCTEDIERFCEENHVGITYAEGYGPELFTTNWKWENKEFGVVTIENGTPIIVPEEWLEQYGLEYGERLGISIARGGREYCIPDAFIIAGSVRCEDYGDGISRGTWNRFLLPVSAWGVLKGDEEWAYSTVQFTIAPSFNREIDMVKEEIANQLKSFRMTLQDTDVMLWMSELRQVVEPFEKNLELMKLLFPVTAAVSVIAGGGLIFLLLLQRTEEAALLRVLGNNRGRTRRLLLSEPVLLSMFGLALGIGTIFYAMPQIPAKQVLAFAGIYLGGCVLGAFTGAIHITRKKPLELLQVKE